MKSEPKALSDYNHTTLPALKELVETQVHELSQSIGVLKDFSNSLPFVIDSMLSNTGCDRLRSNMQENGFPLAPGSITRSPGASTTQLPTSLHEQLCQKSGDREL